MLQLNFKQTHYYSTKSSMYSIKYSYSMEITKTVSPLIEILHKLQNHTEEKNDLDNAIVKSVGFTIFFWIMITKVANLQQINQLRIFYISFQTKSSLTSALAWNDVIHAQPQLATRILVKSWRTIKPSLSKKSSESGSNLSGAQHGVNNCLTSVVAWLYCCNTEPWRVAENPNTTQTTMLIIHVS